MAEPVVVDESCASCRGYHHGDLRRCLLDTARELLVERGVTQFSLRELARRAGVSPRAPYHHFPDRNALLAEVAREGFRRLAAMMAEGRQVADPRARLLALGRAYLRFTVEHPADFQTMHCDELCELENFPDRPGVAEPPFHYLLQTLQEIAGREIPKAELERIGLVAWAAVRGLAALRAEGVLGATFPGQDLDEVLEDTARRTTDMLITQLRCADGR